MANTVPVTEKPIASEVDAGAYVLGIQDNESGDPTLYRMPVSGVRRVSPIGERNELYNDIESHTITEFLSNPVEAPKITENNHIEGADNKVTQGHSAYANSNNHVEGTNNEAGGFVGHVEGSNCKTFETRAHAGGNYSVASASGSFAQGRGVIAFGLAANSTGMSAKNGNLDETFVLGVDGTNTGIDWKIMIDEYGYPMETEAQRAARIDHRLTALWEGSTNPDDGSTNTTAARQFNVAIGHGAHAHGVNCFAAGIGANSNGYKTRSKGQGAATNGYDTHALANYAYCSGASSEAQLEGAFIHGKNCYGSAPWAVGFGDHIVIGTSWQTCVGRWNNNEFRGAFAVGTGQSGARGNGFEVDWDGNVNVRGDMRDMATGKSIRGAGAATFDLSAVTEFDTGETVTISGLKSFVQQHIGEQIYVKGITWHGVTHQSTLTPAQAVIYGSEGEAVLSFSLLDPMTAHEYRIMLNGVYQSGTDVYAVKSSMTIQ